MPFVFLHGSGGGGRKPTLFTPLLSINYNASILTITDVNGDFARYEIYAATTGNFSLVTTTINKTIDLTVLFPTHNSDIDIKVKAIGNDFISSGFSNIVTWEYGVGTEGLAYTLSNDGTHYICSGIGTATATDIEIGSIHDGLPVTEIAGAAFGSVEHILSYKIPDSVSIVNSDAFVWDYYGVTPNRRADYKTVVFGRGITYLGGGLLNWTENVKVIMLPQIPPQQNHGFIGNSYGYRIYVPYLAIEDYKAATNWVNYASSIYPLVNTVNDLASIDTTSYTKACVIGNEEYTEYEYDGNNWEVVQ